VIVSDHEFPDPEAIRQDAANEHLGREAGQGVSKRQKSHVVESALRQDSLLLIRSREQARCGITTDYGERMTVERHEYAVHAPTSGPPVDLVQHCAVAQVDSIECAHRDNCAVDIRGES